MHLPTVTLGDGDGIRYDVLIILATRIQGYFSICFRCPFAHGFLLSDFNGS